MTVMAGKGNSVYSVFAAGIFERTEHQGGLAALLNVSH